MLFLGEIDDDDDDGDDDGDDDNNKKKKQVKMGWVQMQDKLIYYLCDLGEKLSFEKIRFLFWGVSSLIYAKTV